MESEINKAVKNDFKEYPYKQITDADIKKLGYDFYMRNNIPNQLNNTVFIYNLDDKNNSGTHWVTVALQKPDIYYYDPFSVNLGGYPPSELRSWGLKNGYKIIYANEFINQHILSQLCGYYALYIASKIKPLIGKLNEQIFDKIIYDSFDNKPTIYNVKKITKWSQENNLL